MLKTAEEKDFSKICEFSKKHPLAVHTVCKMKAYGTQRDFLKVWFNEDENGVSCAISSFFGAVTVSADERADFKEIKAFLDAYGYLSLCGEKSLLLSCGFSLTDEKTMFKFTEKAENDFEKAEGTDDLKQVYCLISSSIPNSFSSDNEAYLSFLSDFTFRERRSLARVKVIKNENEVVSCALTSAESEIAALISGVASKESVRGMGLGKKTVLTLVDELKSENKDVYVIALNESAKGFYKKIGFSEALTVGYIER